MSGEQSAIDVLRYGGGGPAVVVLDGGPGAPGSARSLARDLAARFEVLEPLQRRSGAVPLTVERHVEDLADVAPARAAIVGWSWGAMLGLSFASRHPDRVPALVLVGCGTYDEASRVEYEGAMAERLGPEGRARTAELADRLRNEPEAEARDHLFAELGRLAGEAQRFDPLDTVAEPLLDTDYRGFEETWTDVLRLQREGIEPAAFSNIRCPVLMIHGDQDPHPGPAIRDVLRAFIPQLEYVGLAACGHEPWRERRARDEFFGVLYPWMTAANGSDGRTLGKT